MNKVCKTCGKLKPIECFRKVSKAQWYYHQCKDCHREYNRQWRKRNKKRVSEWNKRYARKNKEYSCHYYIRNKEIMTQSHKEWLKKNSLYHKKLYLDNKEAIAKTVKRWKTNNPGRVQLYAVNRRAIKKGASGSSSRRDILTIYEKQRGFCFYCGVSLKDNYHIDHFMPLSKGGTNYPSNLRLACPKCNCSKGARIPQEFLQTEFLRLF